MGKGKYRWILMCRNVPSYRLLPTGTYRPIITSRGANKYYRLTTRTTWGLPSTQHYHGNHISTKCRTKHTKTGIQRIERVRRSAARFVTGDYRRTSCVSDMCTNLMCNSLYTERRIRDATMFFLISTD